MAQRSRVPQFGNWANGDNTSYTVYFDKARKGPNGPKMINPNDPQENPNINLANAAPAGPPAPRPRAEKEQQQQQSRAPGPAGGAIRTTSPNPNLPPRNDNMAGRSNNTRNQQPGGRGPSYGDPSPKRPSRTSAGSERHSFEKSPVHHHHARSAGASPSMDGIMYSRRPSPVHHRAKSGSASPAVDGRFSYEKIHGTPGRSYQKPVFNPVTPERGPTPTIPKFGGWDEKNPASGDGYTGIFNKVREEKRGATPQRVFVESTYDTEASKPHRDHSQVLPMVQKLLIAEDEIVKSDELVNGFERYSLSG